MPSSGIHSPAHRRQPPAVGLSQAALALGGGFLVALALPPWGWWPLAFVGIAVFEIALGATPRPGWRFVLGTAFGFGWLAMGVGWMWQLTVPGYVAASLLFAVAHGLAELASPPGRWRVIGRPAAHTLVEAVRFSFPSGGVPLASLGISQAASPVGEIARVGGVIMVTWVVFQVGFALGALVENRTDRIALGGIAAAVAMLLVAFVAPTGHGTGRFLDVAAVQGGGEQGTSALEVPSALVTARHLEATRTIEADGELDLVLWPENVIDIDDGTFTDSEQLTLVAAEAARLGVPFAVGVTEDAVGRPGRIFNAQVIVTPDGAVVDRYDKVRRVPFGEYVPMRGLLEALGAPLDQVPSDAIAGTGPAVLELPDGTRPRRGHLVGGLLRRPSPRRSQGRRRGDHQPDQWRQLHGHRSCRPSRWRRAGCGPSRRAAGSSRPHPQGSRSSSRRTATSSSARGSASRP